MDFIGIVILLWLLIWILSRLNLLNRKAHIIRLYQELAPAERIGRLFDERIDPILTEHGFKFLMPKIEFKRKFGSFTQKIYVSKNKWNRTGGTCSFWLGFVIIADDYNKWHIKKYGTIPMNEIVVGFSHNHLKKWKTVYKPDQYRLSEQDNNRVFEEIKENLVELILPMFDKYSNYETAADELMKDRKFWWAAKIYDFYIMAGNFQKAEGALTAGKEYFAKQTDPERQHFEAFQLRLKEL